MKKNYIHTTGTLALLGMMVAGLWGCQTDDLAEQASASQGALQLSVIDNGYTTGQALNYEGGTLRELPQTRATENGYKTTFTAGDKIGLYAVKSGALAATNVCLTLTNVSGTLQWQPPTGVKLPTDATYYFAYYPYQTSPGSVTTTAITADAFFAGIISAWTPATDQSGTNYTQQDLMVGSGVLSSNKLPITLAHKMGLAVIKLPAGATDAKVKGFTLYSGVSGEYRYLLKPNTTPLLEGSFVDDSGNSRGYAITPTITGGNYKTYTVSGVPDLMSFTIDLTGYDDTYTLPFNTYGSTGDYTLTIDWGDGSTESIPAKTSLSGSPVSHRYAALKEYTITISSTQKNTAAAQIPGFVPGSNNTGNNNTVKLKRMNTAILNTGVLNIDFGLCSNLTTIPADLFVKNVQLENFSGCFYECSNLKTIPDNLFAANTQALGFGSCFEGSGLATIPENLFATNVKATDFSYCFANCLSLTGAIPEKLFAGNTQATNFSYCFSGSRNLEGAIPEKLFANNAQATDFSYCFFYCRSLNGTIPANLFAANTQAINFSYCFRSVALESIPATLFANNTQVTDFSYCFGGCSLLKSIPDGLFAKNTEAYNFASCFQDCFELAITPNIFCNETAPGAKSTRFANLKQQIDFTNCFSSCGRDIGTPQTLPALWEYGYGAGRISTKCFENVPNISNGGSHLTDWQ